ncbi:PREDICTED: serine/threonine-protein kinase Sgk1-B-like [Acropora digitifera]|uniref:serine/threonine-protein kinase Sgk1-B-like n=1 Tax=Acropora digitifera TaxID=70779 RepID=UPI00077A6E96|nr:PREDICTED: serine/threonine-protein kinase Sgk1-B-like [Acropora digitifera]
MDGIDLAGTNNPKAKPSDFLFLKVIGKGSFGKVFLSKNKAEDKFYAIKVLNKAAIRKRNEAKHIMAERNVLLQNIKHPFLVVSEALERIDRSMLGLQQWNPFFLQKV